MKEKKSRGRGKLSAEEERAVEELNEIYSWLDMDYWKVKEWPEQLRASVLRLVKRRAVIGHIIVQYTMIDEMFNAEICRYFFGPEEGMVEPSGVERHKNFSDHILERLYVLQKMAVIRSFCTIPKDIRDKVNRLDALRNAVAHSLVPEVRRDYREKWKLPYKGKDIFKVEGLKLFTKDMDSVNKFFGDRFDEQMRDIATLGKDGVELSAKSGER